MTTQRGSAMRRPIAVGIAAGAAGAALALGALWASGEITSPANAQDPPTAGKSNITLSVAQLRINQRISQAAVRRSNESLNLLDPLRGTGLKGWRTEDLRDGIITGPKLAANSVGTTNIAPNAVATGNIAPNAVATGNIADGAVTGPKLAPGSVGSPNLAAELANRLPMWALVNANGTLNRSSPPGVVSNRTAAGNYRVNFGRDLNTCGFTGTQHNVTTAQIGFVGIQVDITNANQLFVRTTNQPTSAVNAASTDRAFMVQVTC